MIVRKKILVSRLNMSDMLHDHISKTKILSVCSKVRRFNWYILHKKQCVFHPGRESIIPEIAMALLSTVNIQLFKTMKDEPPCMWPCFVINFTVKDCQTVLTVHAQVTLCRKRKSRKALVVVSLLFQVFLVFSDSIVAYNDNSLTCWIVTYFPCYSWFYHHCLQLLVCYLFPRHKCCRCYVNNKL